MERRYYIPGPATQASIEAFHGKRAATLNRWHEMAQKYGANNFIYAVGLQGFLFEGAAPKGWYRISTKIHENAYRPRKNSKIAQDAYLEFEKAGHLPGSSEFSQEIGISFVLEGSCIQWPSYEQIGEGWVLTVPNLALEQEIPSDCSPLKQSEYWSIKEAAEAAEAQAQFAIEKQQFLLPAN